MLATAETLAACGNALGIAKATETAVAALTQQANSTEVVPPTTEVLSTQQTNSTEIAATAQANSTEVAPEHGNYNETDPRVGAELVPKVEANIAATEKGTPLSVIQIALVDLPNLFVTGASEEKNTATRKVYFDIGS